MGKPSEQQKSRGRKCEHKTLGNILECNNNAQAKHAIKDNKATKYQRNNI